MKQISPILVSMLLSIMVVGCSEKSQDYHVRYLTTIENDTIFETEDNDNRILFIKIGSNSNTVAPLGYIKNCNNKNRDNNCVKIPKKFIYGNTMFTVKNKQDFEENDNNAMVVLANSMKNRFSNPDNCKAIIHVPSNTLIAGCAYTHIPTTVTKIGKDAFSHLLHLDSIEIPNSVIEIGEKAFEGTYLKQIRIPNSVERIGQGAFSNCHRLKSITIPFSIKEIEDSCFYDCVSLNTIILPESIKKIGKNAFNGCHSLNVFFVPIFVEKIGEEAFYDCSNLEQIIIPASVKEIGKRAFSGCSKLPSLQLPETVVKIDSFAFEHCDKLETIYTPNSELYDLLSSNQELFFGQDLFDKIEEQQIPLKFSVNGATFEMLPVEGGSFTMEYPGTLSIRKVTQNVTLSNYHIGKYEVTQKLWEAVMHENNSHHQKGTYFDELYENESYFDNFPVENVNWEECQEFITKLNKELRHILGKNREFALPTDAQWEYAARGGNKSKGYKFSGDDDFDKVGWRESPATRHVGKKKPNELGIFDMSGNVSEWCYDYEYLFNEYFDCSKYDYHTKSIIDPSGPAYRHAKNDRGYLKFGHYRVKRGGDINYLSSCDYNLLVNKRGSQRQRFKDKFTGFRLVLNWKITKIIQTKSTNNGINIPSNEFMDENDEATLHEEGDAQNNLNSNQNASNSSSAQYVVIDATDLRLRYGPSTSADTYKWGDGSNRHPNKGEKYRYLGESGDFYKIDYKGVELWVSKQFTYLE